jgi:hypothetical protein
MPTLTGEHELLTERLAGRQIDLGGDSVFIRVFMGLMQAAVLHNAAADLGISLGFNIQQLPVFSLWKNNNTR